jgi:hypothetical protein
MQRGATCQLPISKKSAASAPLDIPAKAGYLAPGIHIPS